MSPASLIAFCALDIVRLRIRHERANWAGSLMVRLFILTEARCPKAYPCFLSFEHFLLGASSCVRGGEDITVRVAI